MAVEQKRIEMAGVGSRIATDIDQSGLLFCARWTGPFGQDELVVLGVKEGDPPAGAYP